jgi:DNA primase
MTPVRKAVALALLQPAVTASVDPAALRALGQPGLDLLADLAEFFRDHPGATAATVVMNWAGTERGAMVEKLLTLTVETPEDGVAAEFEGLIADLSRQGLRQRRQALEARLDEVGYAGLTQAEKDEYSALIRAERKEPQGGQNT